MKQKTVICFLLMLFVAASSVQSESIFRPSYEQAVRQRRRGTIMTWTSVAALSAGIFFATRHSNIGALSIPSFAIGIYTGIRGPMIMFDGIGNQNRLEIAMNNEDLFDQREKDAILGQEVFVGMSEVAVFSSWGLPRRMNTTLRETSEVRQLVYGTFGPYVYTENGSVRTIQH